MIVEKLLFIALPTTVAVVAVRYKIPDKYKKYFFAVPLLLSATLFSWVVMSHVMAGVMAGPAILVCDLILLPLLLLVKRGYEKRCERNGTHPYSGIPWMQNYTKSKKVEVA